MFSMQYTLETFTEGRSTAWAYEPFRGQPIDGPMNGPAPLPWDIPVHVPDKFMKKENKLEVPHTASVKVGTYPPCAAPTITACLFFFNPIPFSYFTF